MSSTLQERFHDLVHRHITGFTPRNGRGVVLCIFHKEKTPSLSIDLEKCVFYCFGCGVTGGVKRFAELVGEPWGSTRSESRTAKARRARFLAEQQARAILERRAEEQDKQLSAELRTVQAEVDWCVYLLTLFHKRPDLAEEFSDLVAQTEKRCGEALFQLSILEARLDGEVE